MKVMVKPPTNQSEEDDESGDVAEHPPEGDL